MTRRLLMLALGGGLLLGSCATEYEVPAAVAGPIDSTFRATGLSPRKVKFTGPVTLQIGGTNNTATATAIAKAKAPVAAAPHAVATETTTKAGTPWYVYAALVVGGIGLGLWLAHKFSLLSFFK
jgi:hypothetical protein